MTIFDRRTGTVIITGASGFLGQQLVPMLAGAGYRLMLCGRAPDKLARQFPEFPVCSLEDLPAQLESGPYALLHLAVMNSNEDASEAAFREANVTYLERTLQQARAAGVRHVIYPSSFHVERDPQTAYAKSKMAAEATLSTCSDMLTTILKLPAVYGASFQGRLAVLNRVPRFLRGGAFNMLHSLRPTVHIDLVFEAIEAALGRDESTVVVVADNQDQNPAYRIARRGLDLAFAGAVVFFLWWLLLLIWAAIRLTSPGPGLFIQERVGRHQAPFYCYKFRTMQVGTQQVGTHEAPQQAITRVGSVLRRLKLDELPQIVNLIRGEMSLVGPRPCLPVQHELVAARAKRDVFEMCPGVSGLAQVNGVDMSTPEALARIDQAYAQKRDLIMDVKIILATLPGVPVPASLKTDL